MQINFVESHASVIIEKVQELHIVLIHPLLDTTILLICEVHQRHDHSCLIQAHCFHSLNNFSPGFVHCMRLPEILFPCSHSSGLFVLVLRLDNGAGVQSHCHSVCFFCQSLDRAPSIYHYFCGWDMFLITCSSVQVFICSCCTGKCFHKSLANEAVFLEK